MDLQSYLNISLFHPQTILPARKTTKKGGWGRKRASSCSCSFVLKNLLGHKWLISKRFGSDLVRVSAGKPRGSAVVSACDSHDGWLSFSSGSYRRVRGCTRLPISELPWINFGQLRWL